MILLFCILMSTIFLPIIFFMGWAAFHLCSLIVSDLSSRKDEELERQKRKDELEQLEQTLEKNCPGYIRISRYYGL